MKVSLAWIFDHINAPLHNYTLDRIVTLFSTKTAEIENVATIELPLDQLSIVRVSAHDEDQVTVLDVENDQTIRLPLRPGIAQGQWYMVRRNGTDAIWRWATVADLGASTKEGLLAEIKADEAYARGLWRMQLTPIDYVLEIDNKALTHRPDMWGHRGFAREIAALLKVPLKSLDTFLATRAVQQYPLNQKVKVSSLLSVRNAAPDACTRFAVAHYSQLTQAPSVLPMAARLAAVDARPINALVDATNYVMFDIGQPMHAFDARLFAEMQCIEPRMACAGESLTVLDGQTLSLTEHDLVISNGQRALGLAGVMGGLDTGVRADTQAVVVEAGIFDATVIRKSAARYKKRTEASARFEKGADPVNTVIALQRFEQLLNDMHLTYQADQIVVLGAAPEPRTIDVTHHYIQTRIGVQIAPAVVVDLLERLGFVVTVRDIDTYHIVVPHWRAGKDVTHQDDIVEEITRFYGYENIAPAALSMPMTAKPLDHLMRLRAAKRYCAYAMHMYEVYNYALFDEPFLQMMAWDPTDALSLKNPVSLNAYRLVTSLVPGLLKNIIKENAQQERARFFECNRTWRLHEGAVHERTMLSGIWYDRTTAIDFYHVKALLTTLFASLGVAPVWEKMINVPFAWCHPYQTAALMLDQHVIGYVSTVDQQFLHRGTTGYALVFELDWGVLAHYKVPVTKAVPLSKFQSIALDVSTLITREVTVAQLTHAIQQAYAHIERVALVDFFEKDEWPDKRSVTMRFWINHTDRQLNKQDIDEALQAVQHAIISLGGAIR